ncbi:Polyprenol reductase 2 [Rhypophila sp. PSN 637]
MEQHHIITTGLQYLSTISPAQWCQIFYRLAAGCVLIVASTPAEARTLLINYGARKASTTTPQSGTEGAQQRPGPRPSSTVGESENGQDQNKQGQGRISAGQHEDERETLGNKGHKQTPNVFVSLISLVTSYGQVPHSWFAAFYMVSVGCSLFWGSQYVLYVRNKGGDGALNSALGTIAAKQVASTSASSGLMVNHVQLAVAWSMMFLQGSRRVYEHMVIMRPSKSTMWFVHWVLGLGFYVVTNVAVWVEGSETILGSAQPNNSTLLPLNEILTPQVLVKLAIGTATFLYAYTHQYITHAHLASLRKYSLPSSDPKESGTRLFKYLVCPHYTCECLVYLAIAITASPAGQVVSKTLLCGLVFVVVNLGVTARGTRAWYVDKFGKDAVKGKWNMIPWVF